MPKFLIERTLSIEASAASVFSEVRDFRGWEAWSPWLLAEPNCEVEYAEDGNGYSWKGNIVGAGEMELLKEESCEALHCRLTFLTPWKSTSAVSFYFEESNGKTNTRWTMEGSLPFFLFWMKGMMMAAISMDYDRGLRMLKDKLELGKVPSKLEFVGYETVPAARYIGVERECAIADISENMVVDLATLGAGLKVAKIVRLGNPIAFYHKHQVVKGLTRYTIAVPVREGAVCPEGLRNVSLPNLKTYTIRHRGPYRHLGNAWAAGMMHSRAKLFSHSKKYVPFEIYENDPNQVDEAEVVTSIHFPIK